MFSFCAVVYEEPYDFLELHLPAHDMEKKSKEEKYSILML